MMVDTTLYTEAKNITLTDEQQEILDILLAWSSNELSSIPLDIRNKHKIDLNNKLSFTLGGSAGTGKTTLMHSFLKQLRLHGVCVSAPTHKAKKVIASKTGKNASTIQKLLGLKPNLFLENFDINNISFEALGSSTLGDYRIVIIDEASMLNSDLYDMITNQSQYNNVKILYIGDPLQLPPVNEHISKVFLNTNYVELNTVIRQADGNPLADLFALLRKDMLTGTNTFLPYIKVNPISMNTKGEGFRVLNVKNFNKNLVDIFNDGEYSKNPNYCHYVAWRNKTIEGYNRAIRNYCVEGDTKEIALFKDEILLSYSSIAIEDSLGRIDVHLTNSEDYFITKCTPDLDILGIDVFDVTLKAVDIGLQKRVKIVNPKNSARFEKLARRKLQEAKSNRRWKQWYSFKNKFLLIKSVGIKGSSFYLAKDLDYGYGITVHKTQGSTYNHVFVDGNDISSCHKKLDQLKLWYVALSRASETATICLTHD